MLGATACATPLRRGMRVHEALKSVPSGYVLNGPAPPDTVLTFKLALVQNDPNGLVDALYDVSAPDGPKYGQYLSKEEVVSFVSPRPESTAAVNAWLKENGLIATTISPAGDWLSISAPVNKINDLIDAEYSVFTHPSTGMQTIRTLSYSIPADLIDHLDLIHPTISFPSPFRNAPDVKLTRPKPHLSAELPRDSSPCGPSGQTPAVDPACIQYLYDIPTTPATNPSNRLAVTGYDGEWASKADLQQFLTQYRPDMNNSTTFTLQTLDGGVNPQNGSAGSEAAIDVQWTVGLATDVPVTFISVGGDFLDALLDTANFLLGEDSPPQVVSTSYGDDESAVSQKLAYALCNAYAQLGARGVTVINSSGDGGVSGNHYSECTTFVPTFPSGCPFVTSVGGTTIIGTEWGSPFSGGGFSNYWSRPAYQSEAVSHYLSLLGSNDSGLYNASGRGYPDVSAYSVAFDVIVDGEVNTEVGTSCSAPTWASVVALLNDRLVSAGKPALGFLNPFLYSKGAAALTDIVNGNNLWCTNDTGFEATVGWDPVTGLGTPNFTNLKTTLGI
ncbi:hypothetical protein POSPLADRAFT_1143941 [Postia placenta MAD-698-R-SB12]|uniref:tripeptidyl-peptidase II n=1 Tax=Postia placenta MAD-698-R-SB12 TaxID=670580 RepID=A0A1X6MZK2_9APHY|nr:hypothetical protein POSPLADRAFT_1143941 [Postia placenta MAD-698-R-SB12]OSX61672.1 hypothetical protein POSPLADRAFT_1143941 [Postia placenta MAD-698-R-SB12]